jgi:hypothetical protein
VNVPASVASVTSYALFFYHATAGTVAAAGLQTTVTVTVLLLPAAAATEWQVSVEVDVGMALLLP